MAKLTKSVLKGIVKECLVEILTEGIISSDPASKAAPKRTRSKTMTRRPEPVVENKKFEDKVRQTSTALTDHPLMAAIFEDTARTTLQEQYQATPSQPVQEDITGTPSFESQDPSGSVIFEGAGNWAALAFAEKKIV